MGFFMEVLCLSTVLLEGKKAFFGYDIKHAEAAFIYEATLLLYAGNQAES